VVTNHDEKEVAFEGVVPEGRKRCSPSSIDGNHVGSIAPDIVNASAHHQWSWRITIPDGVDCKTPLAGRAVDGQAARKAAEEHIHAQSARVCKTRRRTA
jgi:hypothetical protein